MTPEQIELAVVVSAVVAAVFTIALLSFGAAALVRWGLQKRIADASAAPALPPVPELPTQLLEVMEAPLAQAFQLPAHPPPAPGAVPQGLFGPIQHGAFAAAPPPAQAWQPAPNTAGGPFGPAQVPATANCNVTGLACPDMAACMKTGCRKL